MDRFEDVLLRIALALGIGLLIGLERGWHRRAAAPGTRTAGVRTFTISGLFGGVVAALAAGQEGRLGIAGSIVFGSVFFAYAIAMTVFGRAENRALKSFSATSTITALLTFMLGAYAVLGDVHIAAAAAVATAGVLVIREELHGWLKRITLPELQSVLILLAMTFIALPLLPERAIGPFGGIHLREIWIIAIVLGAVSFAGYIAVKTLGEQRGVLLASAVGGLVSSTAVIVENARRAAAGEGSVRLLVAGAAVATAVSCARVGVLATVLERTLAPTLLPPLAAAMLAAVVLAVAHVRWHVTSGEAQAVPPLRNPFRFLPVLGLAASVGVLIVAGRLIYSYFGSSGAIAGAAIMGLFDVDPMTVSMTQLVPDTMTPMAGTLAITAGVAANILSKAVLGAFIGRGRFGIELVVISIVCLAAGGLALLVVRAF